MKQWPNEVNKKFYAIQGGYTDNRQIIEFESGIKRSFSKNTAIKKTYSLMLMFLDEGQNSEFKKFDTWYKKELAGGCETFLLPALDGSAGNKEYRIKENPTWKGQKYKEIQLEIEEV